MGIEAIAREFEIDGAFVDAVPYGNGHINDTYVARYDRAGELVRYVHQRINHHVFRDPPALMDNIARVTDHAAGVLSGQGCTEIDRRTLRLVPTTQGGVLLTRGGDYWRTYVFIEGARTFETPDSVSLVAEVARAFGQFQATLADFDGGTLRETIPHFHDTPRRYRDLQSAAERDPADRLHEVQAELDFVDTRAAELDTVVKGLADGSIPLRVTHNDTKLNNVMIDDQTGEGICVIDLDTVMPGSALYDFGDIVRTATSPTAEDERELGRIRLRPSHFEALVGGYLSSAASFLTARERDLLAFSGKLITLETGIRFLTDYLEGDHYFKTHRPAQNLDRCRAQFQLVRSLEAQFDHLRTIVEQTERP